MSAVMHKWSQHISQANQIQEHMDNSEDAEKAQVSISSKAFWVNRMN